MKSTSVGESMHQLDLMCTAILFNSTTQTGSPSKPSKATSASTSMFGGGVDQRLECVDAEFSLTQLTGRQRISLAVLAAFCNHPRGMIDFAALGVVKQYVIPED